MGFAWQDPPEHVPAVGQGAGRGLLRRTTIVPARRATRRCADRPATASTILGVTETLTPEGLAEAGIETVILAAPDLQGRLFGKRVPPARFGAAMAAGIDVCTCALAWDISQDLGMDVSFAGFHTGWHDIVLLPDLDTLRRAAWLDGVAVCMADVVEHHGGPLLDIAPRSVLRRQVERLQALGYDAYVGSEPEFYLFRPGYDEAREAG